MTYADSRFVLGRLFSACFLETLRLPRKAVVVFKRIHSKVVLVSYPSISAIRTMSRRFVVVSLNLLILS